MYTVHIFKNQKNIVGVSADAKQEESYVRGNINCAHNAMPHSLMADFESSKLSTLNQIYSDIPHITLYTEIFL